MIPMVPHRRSVLRKPADAANRTVAPLSRNHSPVLFMPCPAGVEPLLVVEAQALLKDLPLQVLAGRGGVEVVATHDASNGNHLPFDMTSDLAEVFICAVFALNLKSRLAQRVLWRVALGSYHSEDQLYSLARYIKWDDWITPDQTLRVDVTARHSPLQSLQFAALRIKDAVCDHLRECAGARPNIDTHHPHLNVHLHLDTDIAHISIDTSGEALFKRGWRQDKGEAPLKETLAAAMLAAADWHGRVNDRPLLDPCCGSGTIAIEAAQIACGMAAGLLRRFAFEKHLPFSKYLTQWHQMRQQAKSQVHSPTVAIYAGDVSFRMTDFAVRNAERAGVAHAIEFKTADVLQRLPPAGAGLMIFNPPYGERIETKGTGRASSPLQSQETRQSREDFVDNNANEFFTRLASHWKRNYHGWTAWVLSPDMKLPSAMRLKESRRVVLFNGPIECRLFRFDVVAGSARSSDQAQAIQNPDVANGPLNKQPKLT